MTEQQRAFNPDQAAMDATNAIMRETKTNIPDPRTFAAVQEIISDNIRAALSHAEGEAAPNEHGKNRYGLDMAYFRNAINRELNQPLADYRPDELARVFARLARTADPAVMAEPEFTPTAPAGEPADEKAQQAWKRFQSMLHPDDPAAAQQPVSDPDGLPSGLAAEAAKHLTDWLNMDLCECEGGHTCGATEVRRCRDQLLKAADAPAPDEPVPWPKREDITEDMRAGFERLYRAKAERDGRTLERNDQGAYAHLTVDADWIFYQRAWADALEATAAPTPTKGEEIHINVDGDSVYTLPLEPTGMEAPRFVVHVPAPDEREIAARALDKVAKELALRAIPGGVDDALERSFCVNTLRSEAARLRAGKEGE